MATLTEEMVKAKTSGTDLFNIKKLNCWGSNLSDVSILREMPNVRVITLSVNKIHTLEDFAYCANLEELYIRRNYISDLSEILYLKKCRRLKFLWMADNPCAMGDRYRPTVLKTLPQLQKLDNIDVTTEELDYAFVNGEELSYENLRPGWEEDLEDQRLSLALFNDEKNSQEFNKPNTDGFTPVQDSMDNISDVNYVSNTSYPAPVQGNPDYISSVHGRPIPNPGYPGPAPENRGNMSNIHSRRPMSTSSYPGPIRESTDYGYHVEGKSGKYDATDNLKSQRADQNALQAALHIIRDLSVPSLEILRENIDQRMRRLRTGDWESYS